MKIAGVFFVALLCAGAATASQRADHDGAIEIATPKHNPQGHRRIVADDSDSAPEEGGASRWNGLRRLQSTRTGRTPGGDFRYYNQFSGYAAKVSLSPPMAAPYKFKLMRAWSIAGTTYTTRTKNVDLNGFYIFVGSRDPTGELFAVDWEIEEEPVESWRVGDWRPLEDAGFTYVSELNKFKYRVDLDPPMHADYDVANLWSQSQAQEDGNGDAFTLETKGMNSAGFDILVSKDPQVLGLQRIVWWLRQIRD